MNKIKALITALVVATSSTAMASPATFSVSVRGSFKVGSSWSTPASQRPVTPVVQIRDHRTGNYDNRDERGPVRYTNGNLRGTSYDFRSSRPAAYDYDRGRNHEFDSLVWVEHEVMPGNAPNHIQVPRSMQFRYLQLEAQQGRPVLDRISVRYHGGAVDEINASSIRITPTGAIIPLKQMSNAVHQIVFYPATGSSGSFIASVAE